MSLGIYLLWGVLFLPGSVTIVLKQPSEQCSKTRVARFTRNHALSYPGQELENHVIKEFSTKYQTTQCAMECFLTKNCKSFNFDSIKRKCQINNATHEEFPGDLKLKNSSTEYHLRDAFWLDEKAIGPCGNSPCKNNGRCLDTKSQNGDRMYICLCSKGWTGKNCDAQENYAWLQWEDWGSCSSSCGYGYQSRSRKCGDTVTGNEVSPTKCYGRDVDYRACPFKECPRWEEWGEWGSCSTVETCGRGYMVRHRNCSNGGKPGVDRYCTGYDNETTACEGIICNGMVRLLRPTKGYYGEGRVELFHDQSESWMSVCAENWTRHAAEITCKQAGFQGAYEVVTNITNEEVNTSSILISTQCNGMEKFLHECKRKQNQNCSNFAGVKCRVKGVWNLWTPWSNCSVSCENGTQVRTRECNYPPPNHGGQMCPGDHMEHQACSVPVCLIDGSWLPWSLWSSCSVSCGNGTQNRSRECIPPKYGGLNCSGSDDEIQKCFPKECPVDCYWLPWSQWSDCSVTCGNGTQNRSRQCISPKYGGRECPGAADEIVACYTKECPVNGTWNPWSDWGKCNVTCGGGMRRRFRSCNIPQYGGYPCAGSAEEMEKCNDVMCPIDGIWTAWSEWGTCNVTCGGGAEQRYRSCNGPLYNGAPCDGLDTEWKECSMENCPIDGVWGLWANWTRCTLTCGNGTRHRNKTCDGPSFGGKSCDGHLFEEQECNTFNCPVDGVWNLWSNWSLCSKSCDNGTQERNRTCSGPYFGGTPCSGSMTQSKVCNQHPCPVDGYWFNWNNWSLCSLTCGSGSQTRNRTCVGPKYGGKMCDGRQNETQSCNTFNCPIDGFWEEWSIWNQCSTTCGGGIQFRNRTCKHPLFDGAPCNGTNNEIRNCNNITCPVDGFWMAWSIWNLCSTTCGGGTQSRNRTCNPPLFGGAPCNGSDNEIQNCNNFTCPVDGDFGDWSEWDQCSVTCGGGIQWRNRSCIGPFFGGSPCKGSFNDSRNCSMNECPVDGIFDTWAEWTDCDASCGGGMQFRNRSCMGPFFGGAPCSGNFSESESCNNHECPVDGIFSDWSTWNSCNVTCGGGFRSRNRTCIGPYFGGLNCSGEFDDHEDCNTHYCPIDGNWEDWADWNGCNVTCGVGIRFRYRNCSGPYFGGKNCSGSDEEGGICANNSCPRPAQWLEWERWEPCSVTCNGGTRTRFRQCNDSLVEDNIGACVGLNSDTQSCHNFTCLPFARHCTELVKWGLVDSTYVEIKNAERMSPPGSKIFCDVEAENGIGVSVIEHENMTKIKVKGFEPPGSFKLVPKYTIPFEEIVKLIDRSANCSQYVEWECRNAAMYDPYTFHWITFWINRTFDKETEYTNANAATYFPGGTVGSGKCACGVTNTCGTDRRGVPLRCHCNKNDNENRYDGGFITNKPELPLRAFCAGDTGSSVGVDEHGNITIGALRCFGNL